MILTHRSSTLPSGKNRLCSALLAGYVLMGGLSACGILPKGSTETNAPVQQQGVELKNVPFFSQKDHFCGPAALAMMINQQGIKTDPDQLAELVYVPDRQGSLQLEVQAAPRNFGLLSYQVTPYRQSLMDAIQTGYPVLVLLNLSLQVAPQWHYAVVVGYNLGQDTMILRSGGNEREELPMYTFLKMWERSKNWGFVALKPDTPVPAFVGAQGYLNALIGLERVDPKNALLGYQQATEAWPKEPWFRFGGGNLYLAANQLPEAEQELSLAVTLYPDFADAWNNLAEVQLKMGRKAEARAAINKALALGGPNIAAYQETADKIN